VGWLSRLSDLFVKGLSENDHALVANYLDEPGRFLFYQMDLVDQQHTLKVARYLLREVAFRRGVDTERLIQAALLHDSGKVRGDMKKCHRVIVGFLRRFAPEIRKRLSRRDRSRPLRYACYVDLVHPKRGAYMALSLGIDPTVAELIQKHHAPLGANLLPEFHYLKIADEQV